MYSMLTYKAPFRPWYFGKSVSCLTDESARWDPGPGSNLRTQGKLIVHFCWRGCFKGGCVPIVYFTGSLIAPCPDWFSHCNYHWQLVPLSISWWDPEISIEQPAYFRSAPKNSERLSDYIECQASDLEKWKMINSAAAASKDDKRTLMKVHL